MSSNVFEKISLLYVEDEPLISLDAMSVLEKCGFQKLACAYTLKSAMAESESCDFDCAILDIRLDKGLDSIGLGQQMAKKGTMVILASGNASDKKRLEEMGFPYFYAKPYDIEQIITEIATRFSTQSSA